jgi:hypothetical protein
LGELKFSFREKLKVEKGRVWFSQKKLEKLELNYFFRVRVEKVRVEKSLFSKLKLILKLGKSLQLSLTLKVGPTFSVSDLKRLYASATHRGSKSKAQQQCYAFQLFSPKCSGYTSETWYWWEYHHQEQYGPVSRPNC